MTNQLIARDQLSLGNSASSKQMSTLIKNSTFLPRVQLFGGNSGLAKQGKIRIGHFGLVRTKEQVDDLGADFDFLPLSWRYKAMDMKDMDNIITCYNSTSSEFERIMAESEGQDTSCMWGPEFLIWLSDHEAFATYYFSSKSARREGPGLSEMLGMAVNLKSEFVSKGKFSWHAPKVKASSNTLNPLPEPNEMAVQIERFNNPKEAELVTAEEKMTERDR